MEILSLWMGNADKALQTLGSPVAEFVIQSIFRGADIDFQVLLRFYLFPGKL